MTSYRAYCWRSGAIDVSSGRTPSGAIKLFTFTSRRAALVATRVIEVNARHAYDGRTIEDGQGRVSPSMEIHAGR